jgi:pectate lyase
VVTDRFVPDNATGAFVAVRDTSNFLQIGHIKKTTTNHYRSVNIPLLASYETGNANFKVAVTAGAMINIYSWYNGFMLDSSSRAVPIKSGSGVYKTNTGVGLYVGVSTIKRISDGLEVFAEPHLQYNLSNITSKNVPYKQKINYAGISLGVRYNLFQTRQQ